MTTSMFVDPLQRYRRDSLIATGGMGEVWRGWDTALNRPVALKILRPEYAGDSIFRARFEAEARHAAGLSHPGIAAVWDVGQTAGEEGGATSTVHVPRPFLVMELVEGQPLSALIKRDQGMDPDVVRDLIAQTGDALAVAHRAGIVHRDVKPANILVTPDRKVKITDFGIARALSAMALTSTGAVMGTPQYLSPEQARGESASPASDVYGLGVVAYECLTGHRPFDKESPVATALAHLNEEVPPLPDTVPADLAAVVMRALSKRPAERFVDGTAFASALRHGLDPRTTGSTPASGAAQDPAAGDLADPTATQVLPAASPTVPPGATGRTDGTVTTTSGTAASATAAEVTEEESKRSIRAIIIPLIVAVVVVVIALIAWLLLRGNGEPSTPSGTTGTATTSATASSSTASATTSASDTPTPIVLDPDDYLGRDVADVVADLRAKGLDPHKERVPNPGDETENTVAGVSPSSGLVTGDSVEVAYYGPVTTSTAGSSSTPSASATASATSAPTAASTAPTTASSTPTTPAASTTQASSSTSAETSSPAPRKESR